MAEEPEGDFCHMQKGRFRNIRQSRNPIIQDNLKNLKFLSHKKRQAQAYYYGSVGQSPLIRSIAKFAQATKPPVHQRLGNRMTLRRNNYNGTNNSVPIRNGKILRRNNIGTPGQQIRRRNFKNPRSSANIRLHRIRQQNAIDCGIVVRQPRFKLRRQQPTNYTVQVENNQAIANQVFLPSHMKHSVRASLNPELQSQILMIQNQSQFSPEVIEELRIFVAGYGVTDLPMHDRFSSLP